MSISRCWPASARPSSHLVRPQGGMRATWPTPIGRRPCGAIFTDRMTGGTGRPSSISRGPCERLRLRIGGLLYPPRRLDLAMGRDGGDTATLGIG